MLLRFAPELKVMLICVDDPIGNFESPVENRLPGSIKHRDVLAVFIVDIDSFHGPVVVVLCLVERRGWNLCSGAAGDSWPDGC